MLMIGMTAVPFSPPAPKGSGRCTEEGCTCRERGGVNCKILFLKFGSDYRGNPAPEAGGTPKNATMEMVCVYSLSTGVPRSMAWGYGGGCPCLQVPGRAPVRCAFRLCLPVLPAPCARPGGGGGAAPTTIYSMCPAWIARRTL